MRDWASIISFVFIFGTSVLQSAFAGCTDDYTDQYLAKMHQLSGFEPASGHGPVEAWPVDGPRKEFGSRTAAQSYSDFFYPFFRNQWTGMSYEYFSEWLKARSNRGETTNVLDLFGGGFFAAGSPVADSITGMRYGPYDLDKLVKMGFPQDQLPPEILGDAFNPKTWDALDRSMRARYIEKMDLVVMRPVFGWSTLPFHDHGDADAYALGFILHQVLDRLSPDGEFYFGFSGWGEEDNAFNPTLLNIIDDIEAETDFEIILESDLNAGETLTLKGVMRPKHTH